MKVLFLFLMSIVSLFSYEEINSENFAEKISSKNVLVKFHATWCVNCKELEENLNQVDLKSMGVTVYKVDIQEQMQLAQKYNIRAIPTVLYIKNGKLISTEMGVKTPSEIKQSIKQKFY